MENAFESRRAWPRCDWLVPVGAMKGIGQGSGPTKAPRDRLSGTPGSKNGNGLRKREIVASGTRVIGRDGNSAKKGAKYAAVGPAKNPAGNGGDGQKPAIARQPENVAIAAAPKKLAINLLNKSNSEAPAEPPEHATAAGINLEPTESAVGVTTTTGRAAPMVGCMKSDGFRKDNAGSAIPSRKATNGQRNPPAWLRKDRLLAPEPGALREDPRERLRVDRRMGAKNSAPSSPRKRAEQPIVASQAGAAAVFTDTYASEPPVPRTGVQTRHPSCAGTLADLAKNVEGCAPKVRTREILRRGFKKALTPGTNPGGPNAECPADSAPEGAVIGDSIPVTRGNAEFLGDNGALSASEEVTIYVKGIRAKLQSAKDFNDASAVPATALPRSEPQAGKISVLEGESGTNLQASPSVVAENVDSEPDGPAAGIVTEVSASAASMSVSESHYSISKTEPADNAVSREPTSGPVGRLTVTPAVMATKIEAGPPPAAAGSGTDSAAHDQSTKLRADAADVYDEEMIQLYWAIQKALPVGGSRERARGQNITSRIVELISASPGAGASTIARGLAETAANFGAARVLVCSAASARKGARATRAQMGLNDVAAGKIALREAITTDSSGKFGFCVAANLRSGSRMMVDMEDLESVFAILREQYDLILIDAPAPSRSFLGSVLSKMADGVVLVVEAGRTRVHAAAAARRLLEAHGAKILGVVLNKRRFYIPWFIYRFFA